MNHPFAKMKKRLCVTSCESIWIFMQVSNMCQAEPKIPLAEQTPPVCSALCKNGGQFYPCLRQAHVHRATDGANVPLNLRWRDTWLSVEEFLRMLHLGSAASGSCRSHSRTKQIQGQDNMWVLAQRSQKHLHRAAQVWRMLNFILTAL